MSRNKFNGELASFASMRNIETIHLDDNEFTGTIPDMFDKIFRLQEFLMQNNKVSGPIPYSFIHLQSLSKYLATSLE
jgi:hypothetical protein